MDINDIVTIIAELVKEEETRKEIYTKILEESDEYDLDDVELGIDHAFDEVYEEFAPEEDEDEEFEEDEDYESDDEDESDDWNLDGESSEESEDE